MLYMKENAASWLLQLISHAMCCVYCLSCVHYIQMVMFQMMLTVSENQVRL